MKIGVFDSGVGGKSVAQAIEQALPKHQIIFTDDQKNVPYGTKTPELCRYQLFRRFGTVRYVFLVVGKYDLMLRQCLLDGLGNPIYPRLLNQKLRFS